MKQSARCGCTNEKSRCSACERFLSSSAVSTGIIRLVMPPQRVQHFVATAQNCARSWSLIKKTCCIEREVSINSVFILIEHPFMKQFSLLYHYKPKCQ